MNIKEIKGLYSISGGSVLEKLISVWSYNRELASRQWSGI